jgi:hypothetical protein
VSLELCSSAGSFAAITPKKHASPNMAAPQPLRGMGGSAALSWAVPNMLELCSSAGSFAA